jgi:hypothetical protein
MMQMNKLIRTAVVVRLASFGAGEIPSEAISDGHQLAK